MDYETRDPVQDNVRQRLYKPISETEYRVVHLIPGKFHDEIQCVLEIRSFQVKTRYEALSYQWGDESNTKPIRLARLTSRPTTTRILTKALPESAIIFLVKAFSALQAAAKRYIYPLRDYAWFLGIFFSGCFFSFSTFKSPSWLPSFIPRDVFEALICINMGRRLQDFFIKAVKLIIEVAETKPWLLAYDFSISRSGQRGEEIFLNSETLQVTTNLELALRYLRQEKRARTLWIDALCINQENEDEKMIQIQRMQWIYANASPVVVWLGGYHGLMETNICSGSSSQDEVDCEHRREIQAAFDYVWARSGWRRLFFGWYFNRNEEKRFRESCSGLCDIARRGWWERLWVIQEVALATGYVQIQCGHSTCDFGEFMSAQSWLLLKYAKDKALQHDFQSSLDLHALMIDFSYSPLHDQGGIFTKLLSGLMMKTVGMFFQDVSDDLARFHELPFAHRLYRILLKTAGRSKCHNDRDRLHAVLGIAGRTRTERMTEIASFMENISGIVPQTIILSHLNRLLNTSSLPIKVVSIFLSLIYILWGFLYDSKARYWTMTRPDYFVTGHREVIEALSGRPGERSNRVDFFTAIARYLAKETGSITFLDVSNCGEDEDEGMPSWVPNWTRQVSQPAYDFANRIKDQAPDVFDFTNNGKTLQLTGLFKCKAKILKPADLGSLQLSPWHGAFEKMLVLSIEQKHMAVSALKNIGTVMCQKSFSMLDEIEKLVILRSVDLLKALLRLGLELLRAGGTTVVYSYDVTAPEMGFLKAGEAAEGDELVFVPGCFHHLVLRSREHTRENSVWWKLVGLVAMTTTSTHGRSYSKSEWTQLLKDEVVHMYDIE